MPNWTSNEMICYKEDLKHFINDNGDFDFNMLIPMPDSLHQTDGTVTQEAIACAKGELDPEKLEHYTSLRSRLNDAQLKELDEKLGEKDEIGWAFKEGVETPFFCTTMHIDGKEYLVETPEQFKRLGEIYLDNKEKYGFETWYKWSNFNWGTKWNACDTSVAEIGDYACVSFQTAWSTLSDALIDKLDNTLDHPFYIECSFEGEGDLIFCPITGVECEADASELFETEVDEWDDEEYSYAVSRPLNEKDIEAILGKNR